MVGITSGSIIVDGIDLGTLNMDLFREHLNAIPQKPTFLRGSVCLNYDPWGTATDEAIIETLSKVKFWKAVAAKGGLDAEVTQDFFSDGERQLFCLSRVILRGSKVFILDEATSKYVRLPPLPFRSLIQRRTLSAPLIRYTRVVLI